MSGEFDVVTAELTAAAQKIRSAVASVTCYTLPSTGASATAFGHDQLAEVFVTFCEKASQVVSESAAGDEKAASDLDASAKSYDATDTGNGVVLTGLDPSASPFAFPVAGTR